MSNKNIIPLIFFFLTCTIGWTTEVDKRKLELSTLIDSPDWIKGFITLTNDGRIDSYELEIRKKKDTTSSILSLGSYMKRTVLNNYLSEEKQIGTLSVTHVHIFDLNDNLNYYKRFIKTTAKINSENLRKVTLTYGYLSNFGESKASCRFLQDSVFLAKDSEGSVNEFSFAFSYSKFFDSSPLKALSVEGSYFESNNSKVFPVPYLQKDSLVSKPLFLGISDYNGFDTRLEATFKIWGTGTLTVYPSLFGGYFIAKRSNIIHDYELLEDMRIQNFKHGFNLDIPTIFGKLSGTYIRNGNQKKYRGECLFNFPNGSLKTYIVKNSNLECLNYEKKMGIELDFNFKQINNIFKKIIWKNKKIDKVIISSKGYQTCHQVNHISLIDDDYFLVNPLVCLIKSENSEVNFSEANNISITSSVKPLNSSENKKYLKDIEALPIFGSLHLSPNSDTGFSNCDKKTNNSNMEITWPYTKSAKGGGYRVYLFKDNKEKSCGIYSYPVINFTGKSSPFTEIFNLFSEINDNPINKVIDFTFYVVSFDKKGIDQKRTNSITVHYGSLFEIHNEYPKGRVLSSGMWLPKKFNFASAYYEEDVVIEVPVTEGIKNEFLENFKKDNIKVTSPSHDPNDPTEGYRFIMEDLKFSEGKFIFNIKVSYESTLATDLHALSDNDYFSVKLMVKSLEPIKDIAGNIQNIDVSFYVNNGIISNSLRKIRGG